MAYVYRVNTDGPPGYQPAGYPDLPRPALQYNDYDTGPVSVGPVVRTDTASYDRKQPSKFYPDRYPTYTDDNLRREKLQQSQMKQYQPQEKKKVCTPRCMVVTAAILFVAAVVAVGVALGITLNNSPEPSPYTTAAPTLPPRSNMTGDEIFRGDLTLADWKYYLDLEDPESSLYQAYEEIFCAALRAQMMEDGITPQTCDVTDFEQGSLIVTWVLTFNEIPNMTNNQLRGAVRVSVGNLVSANPDFRGKPGQVYGDYCALRGGNSPCHQLCSTDPEDATAVVCSCEDGYTLQTDETLCLDDNECALGTDQCQGPCDNTPGGYTCTCSEGYTLADNGFDCTDINECSDDNGGCDQTCTDNDGSFECSCVTGFFLETDGFTCTNEDDCVSDPCLNGGACVDGLGHYTCDCVDGTVGVRCEVLLESSCNVTVTICGSGYIEVEEGCQDINECDMSPCEMYCNNTEGSFVCTCDPGMVLHTDGTSCYSATLTVMDLQYTRYRAEGLSPLCQLQADPAIEDDVRFSWTDNQGVDITDDITERFHWLSFSVDDTRVSALNLSDLMYTDSGEYTCTAEYNGQQTVASTQVNVSKCYMWEHDCDDKCISPEFVCDGRLHCLDYSDEKDCDCSAIFGDTGGARCAYGLCIELDKWCNGIVDCRDGSDESEPGCVRGCPEGYYQCPGEKKCIPPEYKCDVWPDCQDSSDETQPECQCPPVRNRWPPGLHRNRTTPGNMTLPPLTSTTPRYTTPYTTPPYTTPYTPPYSPRYTTPYPNPTDFGTATWRNPTTTSFRQFKDDGSNQADAQTSFLPTTNGPGTPATTPYSRYNTQPPVPREEADPEWFTCDSGQCVPGYLVCDGYSDCTDASDEDPDRCYSCPDGYTWCGSPHDIDFSQIDGQWRYPCVLENYFCNGVRDCYNGADEIGCPENPCTLDWTGNVYCNESGRCIPQRWQCDRDNDCGNYEDEVNCQYCVNSGYSECNITKRCIPTYRLCDGTDNCGDGEDEQPVTCDRPCSSGYFQCTSTKACILEGRVCDGNDDCEDGSDEAHPMCPCDVSETACNNGLCMPSEFWCNRFNDCGDWTDETSCTCDGDTEFMCPTGGGCKPFTDYCDGIPDCIGASDEGQTCMAFCETISNDYLSTCGNRCYGASDVCNNYIKCPDFSDEMGCDYTCQAGEFACKIGACLDIERWCDGAYDCLDNSDEPEDCAEVCPSGYVRCEADWPKCAHPREFCLDYIQCNTTETVDCGPYETEDTCGQSIVPPKPAYKFVSGGEEARPNSWPWVATLGYPELGVYCGGSVVSSQYLVTSAFCVQELQSMPPSPLIVMLGQHNLLNHTAYGETTRTTAVEVTVHPWYATDQSYDIAVVKLAAPVPSSRAVQPVCFSASAVDEAGPCAVAGWNNSYASRNNVDNVIFSCNFEYGMCGMITSSDHYQYKWIRDNCGTGSSGTGPTYDHTLDSCAGTYIYTEASNVGYGSRATLYIYKSSMLTKASSDIKLSFWYHMYGDDIGTLEVVTDDYAGTIDTVWHKTGEVGNSWEYAEVTISGSFAVITVTAISAGQYEGDIAIDDILITTSTGIVGPLPEPGPTSNLHQVYLNRVDAGLCKTWYGAEGLDLNANTMLCAGERDASVAACGNNDVGAGLVCSKDGVYSLRGVVSSANTNCVPTLFTDVSHFAPWINRMIGECPPDYIKCTNTDFCILPSEQCNNINDCGDGEDEIPCACNPGEEKCSVSGVCIDSSKLCDRVNDCGDWLDEQNCNCTSDEHRCDNSIGRCIPDDKVCDMINDCGGWEEENECECNGTEFHCTFGPCRPLSMWCDGNPDCPDASDEPPDCVDQSCPPGFMVCDSNRDGKCISPQMMCDGVQDCNNGEDEFECPCPELTYQCADRKQCVPFFTWCNGYEECGDHSDEAAGCEEVCPPELVRCNATGHIYNKCIPESFLCDGSSNCYVDNEDEHGCPCRPWEFACVDGSACHYQSSWCDGRVDCADGSDEVRNCPQFCPDSLLKCNYSLGQCIAERDICNFGVDCLGGEDEDHCTSCNSTWLVQCNGIDHCIPSYLECDGIDHCGNAADESSCPCDSGTHFQCSSNQVCIPRNQLCNGVNECGDGEDERQPNCDCGSSKISCSANSGCYWPHQMCDGQNDCGDWEDEIGCGICNASASNGDQFRCDSGECFSYAKYCDGSPDCSDSSDEVPDCESGCPQGFFRCTGSGKCIPQRFVCDWYLHCPDMEDEVGCPCPKGSFGCDDGLTCVDVSNWCDGSPDCPSGDDEMEDCSTLCPPDFISCNSTSECVGSDSVCDHRLDCTNGEDEFDCGFVNPCRPGNVPCNFTDVGCIPESFICDNFNDCYDSEDELDCPLVDCGSFYFNCEDTGSCKFHTLWCDGNNDCSDGSDEPPGCRTFCPRTDMFLCSQSLPSQVTCLPDTYYCNGFNNCPNGEDERDCPCSPGFFKCPTGECEYYSAWCNNYPDCADGSDESANCMEYCPEELVRCNSTGRCIRQVDVCDNNVDCSDGEDEKGCVCPEGKFKCANDLECEEYYDWCNNYWDCADGSDEWGNCSSVCPPEFIPCNYTLPGQKIKCLGFAHELCNNRWDCPDGEDEKDCPCPYQGQVKCNNTYLCIWDYDVCDGQPDCTDYEDEIDCGPCTAGEFSCEFANICIPEAKWCDGRQDCPDNSDEPDDCTVCVDRCAPNQLVCDNAAGMCLNGTQICDGVLDCDNWEDEITCVCDEARCDMGLCIPTNNLCDKKDDCPDQSDEASCTAPCGDMLFECDDQCISQDRVCNGVFNCRDESDETSCTGTCNTPRGWNTFDFAYIQTASDVIRIIAIMSPVNQFNTSCASGQCIANSKICDGVVDCSDQSDESNCQELSQSHVCPSGWFRCNDGSQCIPDEFTCDLIPDCRDNSDEGANCPCPPPASMFGGPGLGPPPGWGVVSPPTSPPTRPTTLPPTVGPPTTATTTGFPTGLPTAPTTGFPTTAGPPTTVFSTASDETPAPGLSQGFAEKIPQNQFVDPWDRIAQAYLEGIGAQNSPAAAMSNDAFTSFTTFPTPGPLTTIPPLGGDFNLSDWRQCSEDGLCLPGFFFCDGFPACMDDSDEWQCNPNYCTDFYDRQCDNGQCYADYQACNGVFDCNDRSDELNCEFCPFTCADTGLCLREQHLCDGNNDCGDWSDELNCGGGNGTSCADNEYMCTDPAICLSVTTWCDEHPDCPDGSDEAPDCGSNCLDGQFSCGYKCISSRQVCDGMLNCLDGSDEAQDCECAYGTYRCDNNECKNEDTWCDAKYDCLDKSDDIPDCRTTCPPSYHFCEADARCFHPYDVCLNRTSCTELTVAPPLNCSTVDIPEATCGISFVQPKLASAFIFYGEEATPHSWPWQVSLRYRYFQNFGHTCGGSIVAPNWVLTASHCVENNQQGSDYYILVGNHDQDVTEQYELRVNIIRIIMHPQYNTHTIQNDIALLELAEHITFNEHVQPVCVLRDDKPAGTLCTVTGWGDVLDTPGATTRVLNQVHVPITRQSVCIDWHSDVNIVDDSMVCIGDGSRGSCYGDSGGPFVCPHGAGYGLQGIVSWGQSGCRNYQSPSVMARVPHFTGWIEETTNGEVIPT